MMSDAGIPFSETCYNAIMDNMEDESAILMACEWDASYMESAGIVLEDYMMDMMGGDDFDYMDYMPSYEDASAYFMDNSQGTVEMT